LVSFIIDENHLRQLSPEARSELLQIIGIELANLENELADRDWDPEGTRSYPLNADEARVLIRGLGQPAKSLLRTFCVNYDGKELGHEISAITQRMHTATGNPDAWLFNWHARDWEWDEKKSTYAKGRYYISGPAITSLRTTFGIGNNDD
jgi:hypothetical protein